MPPRTSKKSKAKQMSPPSFPWTNLPREVADLVISHLKMDKNALLACSLVCRSLCIFSSRYLLLEIDLPWCDKPGELERAERLLTALLSSTRISSSARSLSITFHHYDKAEPIVSIYVRCLQQFSKLTTLNLHGNHAWNVIWQSIVPVPIQSSILELVKRNPIDTLYVDRLRGVPYDILTSCAQLSTVGAEYFSFVQSTDPPPTSDEHSSRYLELRNLRLSEAVDESKQDFIQWLQKKDPSISLSFLNNLTIFMPGNKSSPSYIQHLTRLLKLVDGDSLQSLYIDFRREHSIWDVSSSNLSIERFQKLRNLRFHIPWCLDRSGMQFGNPFPFMISLMNQLNHHRCLEEVSVKLWPQREPFHRDNLLLLAEDDLRTGLVLSEIPSLRRLVFILATRSSRSKTRGPSQVNLVRGALVKAFHRFKDKGLLFFETTSDLKGFREYDNPSLMETVFPVRSHLLRQGCSGPIQTIQYPKY